MSAYGTIPRPAIAPVALHPRLYPLRTLPSASSSSKQALLALPLTLSTTPSSLVDHLHGLFAAELERGNTYPQEGPMSVSEFEAYFFAYDVFVGVLWGHGEAEEGLGGSVAEEGVENRLREGDNVKAFLERHKGERPWGEVLGGFYYVKPNYPGRSSHNCNAGFIVDPTHGGSGVGTALGRSYLYYAPRLGYRASVFNLVYSNNTPSLKIWDKLGFERVGRIPRAGRLKKRGSDGEEEYVDAIIVWKEFDEVEEAR